MKAVIKETGETVEVTRIETKRIEGTLKGAHEIFYPKDLEVPCIDADWEQRRYELAKAAMQGYCANTEIAVSGNDIEHISEWSVSTADAMIQKLKGGKE